MTEVQSQREPQKTVLYDLHQKSGARFTDFGGWLMPIQYSTIQQEHQATRRQAGLFDLCHMGRLLVTGPDHRHFLHHLVTNHVHDLEPGRARYNLVTNENGGVLDDILIYAETDQTFVVVNASNRQKILSHFQQHAKKFQVSLTDQSTDLAMIAIQGPQSLAIVQPLASVEVASIPYYGHQRISVAGIPTHIARTGYTGEDGFEFYLPSEQATTLWDQLVQSGKLHGLQPVGLGARDTLRLEAGMPLYGHELGEEINPLEAKLGWAVKLKKDPLFIGQEALKKAKENGINKTLVGLECLDKRIPRQGYPVFHQGQLVGEVTSGTASPTLKKNIAQAFVPSSLAEIGQELEIQIRSKNFPARVIPRPFYKRP